MASVPSGMLLLVWKASTTKDFNFVIAKISVITEITEFHEIRPKFRQIFLEIRT
jgi:hypothetical protein